MKNKKKDWNYHSTRESKYRLIVWANFILLQDTRCSPSYIIAAKKKQKEKKKNLPPLDSAAQHTQKNRVEQHKVGSKELLVVAFLFRSFPFFFFSFFTTGRLWVLQPLGSVVNRSLIVFESTAFQLISYTGKEKRDDDVGGPTLYAHNRQTNMHTPIQTDGQQRAVDSNSPPKKTKQSNKAKQISDVLVVVVVVYLFFFF